MPAFKEFEPIFSLQDLLDLLNLFSVWPIVQKIL